MSKENYLEENDYAAFNIDDSIASSWLKYEVILLQTAGIERQQT